MFSSADKLYVGLLIAANIATATVMYLIGSPLITLLLCTLAFGVFLGAALTGPSIPSSWLQTVLPANRF